MICERCQRDRHTATILAPSPEADNCNLHICGPCLGAMLVEVGQLLHDAWAKHRDECVACSAWWNDEDGSFTGGNKPPCVPGRAIWDEWIGLPDGDDWLTAGRAS
jgi:hypothetical protein